MEYDCEVMTFWAYEFLCRESFSEMEEILNRSGPWDWKMRDCAWYPDFLQCRPQSGARICIYALKPPDGGSGYRCVIEADSRTEIDSVLKESLGKLLVENLREAEAYEWPFD